jgi:hypothetical protein
MCCNFHKKIGLILHNLIEYGHRMNMESPMALAHRRFGRFTKWFIITLYNLWTIDTSFHHFFCQFFNFTKLAIFIYLFIYFVVVVVVIHILHCKNMLFPKVFWIFLEKILKNCNMKVLLPLAKNQMHIFSSVSSKNIL